MHGLFKGSRRLAAVVLLLVFGTGGAYAFTNGITVNGGSAIQAGYGQDSVTGFSISNVHYTLDATDPEDIDSVTFTLTPSPGGSTTIKAGAGGNWYSCPSSATPTCSTTSPQLTVDAAQSSNLQVVGAQ